MTAIAPSKTPSNGSDSSYRASLTGFSACRFINVPHLGQRISSHLFQSNVFSSVPQDFGHPDKLAQELLGTADVGLIEQLSILIKHFSDAAKVDVPEYRHKPQFPQNRLKVLDHASAPEHPRGDTDNAGRFVNVFFQTAIENVLQQTRKTTVVLGSNDHHGIGPFHGR